MRQLYLDFGYFRYDSQTELAQDDSWPKDAPNRVSISHTFSVAAEKTNLNRKIGDTM